MILPEMSRRIVAATFFAGFFVQRNQPDDGVPSIRDESAHEAGNQRHGF